MASLFFYRIIEKLEFKEKMNRKGGMFLEELVNILFIMQSLQNTLFGEHMGIDTIKNINLLKRKIQEFVHLQFRLQTLVDLMKKHIVEIEKVYDFFEDKVDKLGYEILKKEFLNEQDKIERLVNLAMNKNKFLEKLNIEWQKQCDTKNRQFALASVWIDENFLKNESKDCDFEYNMLINTNISDLIVECQYIHQYWRNSNVIEEFSIF